MTTLSTGVRVGAYEVVDLIGVGGMGEVYRARDLRLNREVALKILPELFSLDPDRLARFAREAQVLASLNHSNIASIYGFEETEGVRALVLELIEGPTLADCIAQGPIPLEDALVIAGQIAAALGAAHERGIVHRDLKPANIKVRPDGAVKVLDFGLAKALAGDASPSDAAQSPTFTSPALTRMGVILGTAAYMSPEQARGRAVDKRSDIWAFGCVVYEMLTGKRAFDGDDVSLAVANVLKSEPDWAALPAEIPVAIRNVLRRCLEKDPKRRVHDIADAQLDLEEGAAAAPPARLPIESKRWRRVERVTWVFTTIVLAAVLAYLLLEQSTRPRPVRFQVAAPPNTLFGSALGGAGGSIGASSGTVSPDGTQLAFVATDTSGKTMLWLHPLDAFTPRPLPGTDGASLPFWAPDSESIGFFAGGKLKTIDAAGATVRSICDVTGPPRGGTWGRSGIILFASTGTSGIAGVSSRGGQVRSVTTLDAGRKQSAHLWPYFLPDGRHFLYSVLAAMENDRGIFLGSMDQGAPRRLIASDTNAIYAPPGFLLFMSGGSLLRQDFDAERLELTDEEPSRVIDAVPYSPEYGLGAFSASATGVLTFRSDSATQTQLTWFDRSGHLVETVTAPGNYRNLVLSPDESRVAYSSTASQAGQPGRGGGGDIHVLDLSRKQSFRLTVNPGAAGPVWFPDGSKIAYRSNQDGGTVFEKAANGAGSERVLLKAPINGPSQISPDGKFLLFFVGRVVDGNIFVLPLTGDPKPIPLLEEMPYLRVEPQLSPNGRWLAYVSDETGRNEVWVQPYPRNGAKWQVSTSGGRQPLWRADGKELFFVSDDRRLYAADVRTEAGFDYGTPRFLFDIPANVQNVGKSYAPSRDGQRFLVNMLRDNPPPIDVVLNWQEELKQRVATR